MAFWNRKDSSSETSSNVARQDTIYAVENEIAAQNLHYTYNNDGFTVHTPDGDQQFNWKEQSGLQQTLNWLKKPAHQ